MQITVNGVPLLAGQAKAIAIAMARQEADLESREETGDQYKDEPARALLKLTREVRDLLRVGPR